MKEWTQERFDIKGKKGLMEIYKDKCASRPYYFVRTGSKPKSCKHESPTSTGYIIQLWCGKWVCDKGEVYDASIKNDFICVVDNKESANDFIDNAIINAVLNLIPRARKREKDEGLKAAQRCILTWLSCHPNKLPQLKSIIIPEDFSTSLYQEIASIMYHQIEQGKMNLIELIKNFAEDKTQYQEVAKIFNGELVQETSGSEKTRGIRECVIRLKRHSLQKEADTTDDIKRLQEVMEQLKGLDHLNISF